jgi:Tol biopolymer transport system component
VKGLAGAAARRLTDDPYSNARPEWSPDRRQIAWQKNCYGNLEVFVMDADGSHPRNLTRNPANDEMPSWSPDGKRIVFTRALESVVMRDLPAILSPDYSPDGKKAVFSRGGEIVALDLATGALTRLAGRSSEPIVPVEDLLDPVTGEARPWARGMLGEAHFPRWRR